MTNVRTLAATLLLTLVGLSGCMDFLGDDSGDDGTDDGMDDGTDDGMDGNQTDDDTTDDSDRTYHATLDASSTSGDVPLNVTFTSEVSYTETSGSGNDTFSDNFTYEGNLTYQLAFGDGSSQEGNQSDYPLEATHEYTVTGNYTATVSVTFDDGETASASVNITVEQGDPPKEEPDQLVFDVGPTAGCDGTVEIKCATFQAGPGSPAIDGFWVPLDERYYGYDFVSETTAPNALGDTDGVFTDADGTPLPDDINNGSGPAQGTVPNGAEWLFVYNYVVPSQSMTVTFSA